MFLQPVALTLTLSRRARGPDIAAPEELPLAVGDPAFRQIIGRQLDPHLVARNDADEVLPHLAGDAARRPYGRCPVAPETAYWPALRSPRPRPRWLLLSWSYDRTPGSPGGDIPLLAARKPRAVPKNVLARPNAEELLSYHYCPGNPSPRSPGAEPSRRREVKLFSGLETPWQSAISSRPAPLSGDPQRGCENGAVLGSQRSGENRAGVYWPGWFR